MLCKIERKIAPFGVVAGQEHRLAAESVGVVFQIGIYFLLDVGILGEELVVSRRLGLM